MHSEHVNRGCDLASRHPLRIPPSSTTTEIKALQCGKTNDVSCAVRDAFSLVEMGETW